MIKKIILVLLLSTIGSYLSAETVAYKLKGELKFSGLESVEVASTPLVDDKIINKSKKQIINIVAYAENQSKVIIKKNKNRRPRPKFKGTDDESMTRRCESMTHR